MWESVTYRCMQWQHLLFRASMWNHLRHTHTHSSNLNELIFVKLTKLSQSREILLEALPAMPARCGLRGVPPPTPPRPHCIIRDLHNPGSHSVAVLLVLSQGKAQIWLKQDNLKVTMIKPSVIRSAGNCCATGLSVLNLCCLWQNLCSLFCALKTSCKWLLLLPMKEGERKREAQSCTHCQSHRFCHRQFF